MVSKHKSSYEFKVMLRYVFAISYVYSLGYIWLHSSSAVEQVLGHIECTTYIMRPIATDDIVAWYVSQSVCLSVARLRCAKTAERIEMQLGGDERQTVCDISISTDM